MSNEHNVFDIATIKQLIKLMGANEIGEIDLQQGDQRIKLRGKSAPAQIVSGPAFAPTMAAPAQAMPAPAPAATAPATAAPAADNGNFEEILSPMIGTFYTKPNPESPAYVKVGDTVGADTIVCLIEAMKTFNEIPAGVSGKVVSVLLDNESPVDVNKPLFKIDPNG